MDEVYFEKYKRYTIQELKGVLKYIDRDAFPERYELAKNELDSRTIVKQKEPQPKDRENNLREKGS